MLDGILRAVGRIEKIASTIAAVFMFAIMMIVFSDVIMRYGFNRPFAWAYDLISIYLMVEGRQLIASRRLLLDDALVCPSCGHRNLLSGRWSPSTGACSKRSLNATTMYFLNAWA